MWCSSGRWFWPLDPRAEDVAIEDVARGLATECRYAGQTSCELPPGAFYSVAEHSVVVSQFVEKLAPPALAIAWAREALLHDASEAYVGDVIRPLKYEPEFAAFRSIEREIQAAVFAAFDVHSTKASRALIDSVDSRILADEIAVAINGCVKDDPCRAAGEPLDCAIALLQPPAAEHVFVSRFLELWGAYA